MLQIWAPFKRWRLVKCQNKIYFSWWTQQTKEEAAVYIGLCKVAGSVPLSALNEEELLPVITGFFTAGML